MLFALSRFGGIPVPFLSYTGSLGWALFLVLQVVQYLTVALALLIDVILFLSLRAHAGPCLARSRLLGGAVYVIDVCEARRRPNTTRAREMEPSCCAHAIAPSHIHVLGAPPKRWPRSNRVSVPARQALTFVMEPAVLSKLLILFIYSYVLSTAVKVYLHARDWWRTRKVYEHLGADPNSRSSTSTFKDDLPNTHQPVPFAMAHTLLAYAGMAWTAIAATLTLSIVPGAMVLLPSTLAVASTIIGVYKLVPLVEDAAPRACWTAARERTSLIRGLTGWLRDISDAQPKLREGLQWPRAFVDEGYRRRTVGDLWGVRFSDAGFLSLCYGLQTFSACLIVGPALCFGVWLIAPMFALSSESDYGLAEAIFIAGREWSDTKQALHALSIRLLHAFVDLIHLRLPEIQIDWEAFADVFDLLKAFIGRPQEAIVEMVNSVLHVLALLATEFSTIEVAQLLAHGRTMLAVNTFAAIMKALVMQLGAPCAYVLQIGLVTHLHALCQLACGVSRHVPPCPCPCVCARARVRARGVMMPVHGCAPTQSSFGSSWHPS